MFKKRVVEEGIEEMTFLRGKLVTTLGGFIDEDLSLITH